MYTKWLNRVIQVTAITVTLMAICQELEKPREERKWHGKVAGFIPYEFRPPTGARLKETYWDPYGRVFSPQVFGIGWTINFYALLENLGIIKPGMSEENFLMPNKSIKEVLKPVLEGD